MTAKQSVGKQTVAELQKEFGAESAHIGTGHLNSKVWGFISTQCPTLDYMIGWPGVPKGRLTTIVGMEGSGKSTTALHILKENQENGGFGILVDSEMRLWAERAENIGLKFDDTLILLQPETLEQGFAMMIATIEKVRKVDKDIDIACVFDSIAGAPTEADMKGDINDQTPASHARFLSKALRRLHPIIARNKVALVFVNQLRHKLEFGAFGPPKMVMLGERSINYWSSLKIHLEQGKRLTRGEENKDAPYGVQVKARIIESRISPREGYKGTFDLDFVNGIDWATSACDVLVSLGAIKKGSAGWYTYDGGKQFRRGDFAKVVAEHEEIRELVKATPTLWKEQAIAQVEEEGDEE